MPHGKTISTRREGLREGSSFEAEHPMMSQPDQVSAPQPDGQAEGLALAHGWASDDRPVFRPKNQRPARDEMWEMKQAVIRRDGLTTCFWCRQPFASEDDATLEHIHPIFAGGVHDLRNCTLACASCNSRNQPRALIETQDERRAAKEARREQNMRENGYIPCPPEYLTAFPTIARTLAGKPMTYANASFYLKGYRRHWHQEAPTAEEKHQFKAHYNRWVTTQPNPKLSDPKGSD